MTSLGDIWNAECTYEQKADWLAVNLTRNYLGENLDAGALAWWRWFQMHGSSLEFYRVFFTGMHMFLGNLPSSGHVETHQHVQLPPWDLLCEALSLQQRLSEWKSCELYFCVMPVSTVSILFLLSKYWGLQNTRVLFVWYLCSLVLPLQLHILEIYICLCKFI